MSQFILLVSKRPDQYLLHHINRTNDATPVAVDVDGGGNRIRFTTLLISALPPISPAGPGPGPDQVQDDRNIVAPTFDMNIFVDVGKLGGKITWKCDKILPRLVCATSM